MTPPAGDSSRALIDRISSLLPDRQLREVRMFGVLALMVDGAMAVAAYEDGSLSRPRRPSRRRSTAREPGGIPREDGSRSLDGRRVDLSRGDDAAQQRSPHQLARGRHPQSRSAQARAPTSPLRPGSTNSETASRPRIVSGDGVPLIIPVSHVQHQLAVPLSRLRVVVPQGLRFACGRSFAYWLSS